MSTIFRRNAPFLIPYLLFLLAGGIVLAFIPKADLHLFFNRYHHPLADVFFTYLTYLGDGITVIIAVILALLVKYRYAILIGAANIISAIITQGLKQFVFTGTPRPRRFFEGLHDLYLVPGVAVYSSNSFPSGHTTAAFTLYFCIALLIDNKWGKALFFLLSLMIGFSRIYLSQHFFSDVYTGSIIGVSIAFITYYIIGNSRRLQSRSWLDSSLPVRKFNKASE